MPPRNTGIRKEKRQSRVDVPLSRLQKAYVALASWDQNPRMSQAEFLRSGRIPVDQDILKSVVAGYMKKYRHDKEVMKSVRK